MFKVRHLVLAAGFGLSLFSSYSIQESTAQDEPDLALQQEKQRQIQAETDFIVRRVGTMLRVLEFYDVDRGTEKKLLEEMTSILGGLSKKQMAEVIRRLETAKIESPDKSKTELARAYDKHREILDSLKQLLARHDAIRGLDQAADRMEKLARQQLEMYLQTNQLIKDGIDRANPNLPPTQRLLLNRRPRNYQIESRRQADDQHELMKDVDLLIKQILDLRAGLPEEQKLRIKSMQAIAEEQNLSANLSKTAIGLKAVGNIRFTQDGWKEANNLQFRSANTMQELARVLRLSADMLHVLKEARDRLDQAIAKQDDINKQTKEANDDAKPDAKPDAKAPDRPQPPTRVGKFQFPEPTIRPVGTDPRKAAMEKAIRDAQAAEKNIELGKQQTRLEYETKGTENLLKPQVADLAAKLQEAEAAMDAAKNALERNAPKNAVEPQEAAKGALEKVRKEVDQMIVAAEKAKKDPLAALQKAADDVERILQDQIDTRAKTKDTAQKPQEGKIPELAKDQKNLAKRTDGLKDTPLPGKEKVREALDKANKAMTEAARNLDAKNPKEALPKQDAAVAALKDAKKEIADKVAEIEKRKDDLAKLDDAKRKLDELASAEKQVAQAAKEAAQKPGEESTKDLAMNQEKLTPKATALAKQMEKSAPEAAQKVADSTKNMEAAKKELEKNKAAPGAMEATEAAKKLEDAQKALAKARDELKGKEVADQAALEQKNVDPTAAAQQIAKALDEAQKAAAEAKQAEKLARQEMKKEEMAELDRERPEGKQPNLARLQADLAKQAADMKLNDASKDAAKAADAIKQGDLPEALKKQENALAKLNDAAKDPMPAEAKAGKPDLQSEPKDMPAPGEAKNADAKNGQPKAGSTKGDPGAPKQAAKPANQNGPQSKAGEAKQAQPKQGDAAAEAKANSAKPGEAKTNDGQAGAPKKGQPKDAAAAKGNDPKAGSKPGEANQGQAKAGDPKDGQSQAKAAEKSGTADKGQSKDALAKAGEGKGGEGKSGQAKPGMAKPGMAKAGEGKGGEGNAGEGKPGQAKAGEQANDAQAQAKGTDQNQALPKAETPGQLAKAQQELMEATKNLAQSQEATKAAMAALGQAKAQAPEAVQKQLEQAGKDLARAAKDLGEGKPAQANQNQSQAAEKLQQALNSMNAALKELKQPGAEPGQASLAKAEAPQNKGASESKERSEKQEPATDAQDGDSNSKSPSDGKSEKSGKSPEKNEPKGSGNRFADGKTSNAAPQLNKVDGDGSFLHLPPRQRDLIRQALSTGLPPEYAAMIQQYYMNLARGKNVSPPR